MTVPSYVEAGVYNVTAEDAATGRIATTSFRVFLVMLNPSSGPVGTKVIVNGGGFTRESEVKITFNDMTIGYALTDDFGCFSFVFNVPTSTSGAQTIKAIGVGSDYAYATFTVIDVTPLDVEVDVGALYFMGEIAEFYVQTTFKGEAVNATMASVMLYKPNGESENLTAQPISTGLYKISYTIIGDEPGTYTLVVTAKYTNETVESFGTAFKCFLVSDTLSLMNRHIIEIKNGVAYVQTDLGFVRLNLTAMNATLETIFLKVLAINGTTATLQTTIGIVNGTIESINGDIATIVVPGIGQIQTDISGMITKDDTSVIPVYETLIFALAAAIGALASLAMLMHKKKTKIEPTPSPAQREGEPTQPHSTT